MLGCIVAGRPTISPGRFLFVLPEPATINHIVVFLTGSVQFDEGTGASIYCNSDVGAAQGTAWKFLGVLTNDKPSAVFKVSGFSEGINMLEVGIAIEPISTLEQLLMESEPRSQCLVPVSPTTLPNPLTIAQRIGENLFNYVTSFTRMASLLEPSLQVVPLKTVQEWYNGLIRKVTSDPDGFMRQRLRVKVADGRKTEIELEKDATWGDLLTVLLLKLDEQPVDISTGFPPQLLTPNNMEQPLSGLGVHSGDTLTVTTSNGEAVVAPTLLNAAPTMLLREMPDDNSCLFNTIGYVLCSCSRSSAKELRELAAALVLSSPNYTEAVLGMPPERYAEWIRGDTHWGGGIELAVFAGHFETEIASIDVGSGRVDIFGEGNGYAQRVYVLYSGIHYDALAMGVPHKESEDCTVFAPTEDNALVQAMQVAETARLEHRYTDLAKFTLRTVGDKSPPTCGVDVAEGFFTTVDEKNRTIPPQCLNKLSITVNELFVTLG
ncbi:Zinc finger, C2H2 domain-containing protein [Paramicrosporidium saccamoebae]|uniref:Ubiquitin thioesterase OTU n=1 Tax=Paramicrosporidium saccamoebae TaxID=1246581 RepID=A0A2H9TIR2_9FUNG|nr:Zinc finger, C2H2 domain-containing protein [Paramicrosporidium saccamoebae]